MNWTKIMFYKLPNMSMLNEIESQKVDSKGKWIILNVLNYKLYSLHVLAL